MNASSVSPRHRYPVGKLIPEDKGYDPNTIRRMVENAARDARLAWAGTAYGRMRLEGNLSDRQFAACHKWAELRRDYEAAIGARGSKSAMAIIDASGGSEPDPDSELGNKIGQSARRKIAEYEKAEVVIKACGKVEYADFRGIVEAQGERAWAMFTEAGSVRMCANALVHHWRM